jgi:hypothetical protein
MWRSEAQGYWPLSLAVSIKLWTCAPAVVPFGVR